MDGDFFCNAARLRASDSISTFSTSPSFLSILSMSFSSITAVTCRQHAPQMMLTTLSV